MNKLQRIEEMEKQLAALRAEVEVEGQPKNSVQQWEPVGGDWFIGSYGQVSQGETDDEFREFGTERPTKKQAEKALDEMRVFNRSLAYRDEFDPEFEFKSGEWNYYIDMDVEADSEKYTVDCDRTFKRVGLVYMSEQVAEELCRKLNSGEVVL